MHEQVAADCNWPAPCASHIPAYYNRPEPKTKSSSNFVLHCFSMFCCMLSITYGLQHCTALGLNLLLGIGWYKHIHFSAISRISKFWIYGKQSSNQKTSNAVQTCMCTNQHTCICKQTRAAFVQVLQATAFSQNKQKHLQFVHASTSMINTQ